MSTHTARRGTAAGMLLALTALACFATLDTSAKLVSFTLPVLMGVWFRYAFQALATTAVLLPRRGLSLFATRRPGAQLVRGLLLAVTSLLGYWGLTFMPVGEFTAIAMITPLAVTLLAALWLGEKVSGLRWLLVAGGFAGTVIIVRPGGALFGWHTLIPLVMVVCYAFFQILTSRLAQTEDAMSMHNYTGWVGTVVASLALPFFWVTPDTLQEWSLLLLMGVMGTVGHYLLILAYRRAPPATLMPLLYVQIGFAMFAGWLVFAHMPDGVSLLGMALIAVCGAASGWLALRENQARPTTDFQTSALREPLEV